ncbi:acyl-CoA dehydrogenase family protein, partial [Arthrospira platensis SPKY1]|nr:acyl-CoA dehydrogenase family protein [Arthrospira platensis SPKY1]
MDFNLSDDQKAFQESARAFARLELQPHAAQWDADAYFPVEVIRKAGALGFCGIYAPESAGGMGLSRLDAHLIF